MLTADTKRRIDSCRDILVGKLPLPTDQVELITLALIYKFMDDLDEESVAMGGRRSFFTGPLAPYRWRELMSQTLSAEERMTRFADGLELLGGAKKLRVPKKNPKRGEEPTEEIDVAAHLPALFRDIFRNAFLKFRDGRILTLFLTELGGFAYSHSEELGNAFEYILSVMGAQGDNGQFRTPRHLIDFMVACLDPQPGQTVLDPACGTGGFLVSAFRHILRNHTSPGSTLRGDRLTHTQRQRLYAAFTGYDINDQMVKLSRVNLFLHDFATPQIHIYDTLTNDARWPEKYDLILANPPFMTPKGGVVPHTRFRVPAKKSEVLFTDYIAEHLTPDGRAGIVVPNGIVATTQAAYVKLRRFLVEDSLVAVVSLPAGCFKPYSGVKTSILLLDKKLARTTDKILFLKIAADGFDLGDKRTPVEANDLPEAERLIRAWLTGKIGDDFASSLAWKVVGKQDLLTSPSVGLNAERFFGGESVTNELAPPRRLGEICEAILTGPFGSSLHQSDYVENQTPVINPQNIVNGRIVADTTKTVGPATLERLQEFRLRAGDIAIARRGEMGRCAVVAEGMAGWLCGTGCFAIRLTDENDARFVAHLIRSPRVVAYLEERAIGVTLKNLNQEILNDLEIPLPPLEEQRRIVAEIEGYQQVIDGARQILAAYRPRFDVEAEWPTTSVKEVARVVSGHGFPLDYQGHADDEVPFYKVSDMNLPGNERFMVRHNNSVSFEILAKLKAKSHPAGTVIFPKIGAAIATNKKRMLTREATFDNNVMGIVPGPEIEPRFLLAWIDGFNLSAWASASDLPSMRQGTVQDQEIPLPPKPEQERIVAELEVEAAKVEAVRGLIPLYEAKIQRTFARVWGTNEDLANASKTSQVSPAE